MPLALNVIKKQVLCSAEKSSVIWAEPYSISSAETNVRSVGRYTVLDRVPKEDAANFESAAFL